MRRRQLLCLPFLLGAWSCPPHMLSDGNYAVNPVEVFEDDCRYLPSGASFDATLGIAGHSVRLDLEFSGLQLHLIGAFEETSEKFYADGSAGNQTLTLNSRECTVDSVNLHLQGNTDDARSFHGAVRTIFQTSARPFCNCRVLLDYRAVHR